jgi:hypothetical protein
MAKLRPLLKIKGKLELNKAFKVLLEQICILLVWLSLIYKQSILSFGLFFIILGFTFFQKD